MRGTYLRYHGPERPLQGDDLGVETTDESQPYGDLSKDIPGRVSRHCKGLGASLVGLKGSKKAQGTRAW